MYSVLPNIHEYFKFFDYPTVKDMTSILFQLEEYKQKMRDVLEKQAKGEYIPPEDIIYEDGRTQRHYNESLERHLTEKGITPDIYSDLKFPT